MSLNPESGQINRNSDENEIGLITRRRGVLKSVGAVTGIIAVGSGADAIRLLLKLQKTVHNVTDTHSLPSPDELTEAQNVMDVHNSGGRVEPDKLMLAQETIKKRADFDNEVDRQWGGSGVPYKRLFAEVMTALVGTTAAAPMLSVRQRGEAKVEGGAAGTRATRNPRG